MPPKPTPLGRVTKEKRKGDKEVPGAGIRRSLRSSNRSASTSTAAASIQQLPTSTLSNVTMPFTTSPESSTTNSHPNQSSSIRTNAAPDTNKPVYFWHPQDGNGFLGQWYYSPFTVDGDTYATAEMWMMVQKARLFKDEAVAKKMLATTLPKRHKALGRQVRGFDDGLWDEHKLKIVETGNYYKFTISDDAANLRSILLATGEGELVEASSMDRIWGVGFTEKNAGQNRHRWGQNLLGKALMIVRQRLREEGCDEAVS